MKLIEVDSNFDRKSSFPRRSICYGELSIIHFDFDWFGACNLILMRC